MTKKQKIIIGVGLGLILLSGLFPAYEGECSIGNEILKKYMGYYFIFYPPNPNRVSKAFVGSSQSYTRSQIDNIRFNANINLSQFSIQIVTILILTIGLVLLFTDIKKDKDGK